MIRRFACAAALVTAAACATPPAAPAVDPVAPAPATPAEAPPEPSDSPPPRVLARPVRLLIPAIGVDTPLIRLGLSPDRTMEVPADFDVAGWYIHSPAPGETGPAVIAGHVDSKAGPAVFYRLQRLEPADSITVMREDGSEVTFTVSRVEQHAKNAFPTAGVYGNTDGPELRLITCGGEFDDGSGHYTDNVIVYARAGAPAEG